MNLSIGTTTDPANKLLKGYNEHLSLTGYLKEGSSLTDPVILIENNGIDIDQNTTLATCNYARIDSFGRWYFITDIINNTQHLWEVHMHVDVLMSYYNQIINSPCVIAKNANFFNLYLNDANYKCYQDDIILKKEFPAGFDDNTPRFIMAIIGDKEAAT